MAIHLACSTVCFRKLPIEAALEEIRSAGFMTIELAVVPDVCKPFETAKRSKSERRKFVDLIRPSGFDVPVVTAAPGPFNAPDADFDALVGAGIAHVQLASELGAQTLAVNCGMPVADRSQFREHAIAQAKGLAKIARHAADLDIRIALEAPHRHGLARTLEEAEFLMDRIGEPNVWFLLDTTHVLAGGVQPVEAVKRFGERIAHVHLRDSKGEDACRVPGEGAVEFRPFFDALEAIRYPEWCAFELDGAAETLDQRRLALRRSIEFVRRQTKEIAGLNHHRSQTHGSESGVWRA
jgi:sugar phosphate isomerase/epimerase